MAYVAMNEYHDGKRVLQVHGDIRHLENSRSQQCTYQTVHGDIRHLEIDSIAVLIIQ